MIIFKKLFIKFLKYWEDYMILLKIKKDKT